MRLEQLQLIRFGHFSDRLLDFGPGLQVVYGPNEAGKSTTLRAVGDLLFGIPERTLDNHLHDNRELRIGAILTGQDGRRLAIVRRKGRKNTLLDPDGTILDEALLEPWLGGMSREAFESMFGLSHPRLLDGAQALLEGKGALGESLFGAGAGLEGIHRLREALKTEAEDLFKPGGSKPPLNQVLRLFNEARKAASDHTLRPARWREMQQELADAEARLAELAGERHRLGTELSHLERIQRVQPSLNRRRDWRQRLAELGPVAELPDTATEDRTRAQQTLQDAADRQTRLERQCREAREARAALVIPEALLAREAEVEELRNRLGAHRKAQPERTGLEASLEQVRNDARQQLRALGRGADLEQAESLLIDIVRAKGIRQLGSEGLRLGSEADRLARELADAEAAVAALEARLARLPGVRDTRELARRLEEAAREGDAGDRLGELTVKSRLAEQELTDALAALPLWQGTVEALAALPLPDRATVEDFRTRFDDSDRLAERLTERQENLTRQRREVQSQLEDLRQQGEPPSQDQLTAARRERDLAWQEVRDRLAGSTGQPLQALIARFETRQQTADRLADRLWRDADRLSRLASLTRQEQALEAEAGELAVTRQEQHDRRWALEADWTGVWQPAGIRPLSPREMDGWLTRHEKLCDKAGQWRRLEAERQSLADRLDGQLDSLRAVLAELEEPVRDDTTLALALALAREVLEGQRQTADSHRELERDLEKARDVHSAVRRSREQADAQRHRWQQQWAESVAPLGLDGTASPPAAEAMLEGLEGLSRTLAEVARLQQRLERIDREAETFRQWVAELAGDCAPQLRDLPTEQAAAQLDRLFQQAREDRRRHDELSQLIDQLTAEREALERSREQANGTLTRLQLAAGVDDPQQLPEAERRSRAYREVRDKLAAVEEQLLGEGLPLETLIEQAARVDPDTLATELPAARRQALEAERLWSEQQQKVWELGRNLQQMDGSDQAAQAAEQAQESLAGMQHLVERYVKIRLTSLVLNREIDRYRQRHQGPLLARAGTFFRRMTLESFQGLTAGFDEADNPRLLCLRADGRQVGVEGLSDGSRDQLYLALRLAGLERQARHGEAIPLVVDDVLINFDQDRAHATLQVLGELAAHTQVLFFTHHRALADLALAVNGGAGPIELAP